MENIFKVAELKFTDPSVIKSGITDWLNDQAAQGYAVEEIISVTHFVVAVQEAGGIALQVQPKVTYIFTFIVIYV